MTDYGKLFSRIWSDPTFTALDARSQQVYAMLLSFSTRNYAGVLPLTIKRWTNATRDATKDNVTAALDQLSSARFTVIDWETEEVLIRSYIRNDEVYRQPNVMKSARKLVLQVESPALRWALHDELKRLPPHKDDDDTLRVINALIEGLSRPSQEGLAEGLAEPFTEGLPEGSGVGGYVSTVDAPSPSPSTSPTPVAEPFAQPPARTDAQSATPGGQLVAAIIPMTYPSPERTMLRLKANEMLHTGTSEADIIGGLNVWLDKPNLGAGALPACVSEFIKTRDRPKPPSKLRAAAELAQRMREEENQAQRKELA